MNDYGYDVEQGAKEVYSSFNHEAEQSVIGGLLLDGDLIDSIDGLLSPEDFYNGAHAEIFRAMLVLAKRGQKIDWLMLQDEINQDALLPVGGVAYGVQLIDSTPATANIISYANNIRDKSTLRSIAMVGSYISEDARGKGSVAKDVLEKAEEMLFSLAEENERSKGFVQAAPIIRTVLDNIEKAARGDKIEGAIHTGFKFLDHKIGSLMPGSLYILAGRPAMGKTAFAMNIAANAAIRGKAVCGIFSLEMTEAQLMLRMLGSEAGACVDRMIRGKSTKEESAAIQQNAPMVADAKIYINDSSGLTISDIRSRARRLKREKGIELLVIDYLGKISGSNRYGPKVHEVTEIVEGLKDMAKELNIPVIALAQLNRGVESRSPPIPRLSDLRDSGSIEQEADVVMLLYRPEVYFSEKKELVGKVELIIDKNRHGKIGMLPFEFMHESIRFNDIGEVKDYEG